MMQMLLQKLTNAVEAGKRFIVVMQYPGGPPVEAIAEVAEDHNWHVRAVWRGEAAVVYILLRYEAP